MHSTSRIGITGTGLWRPPGRITNEDLVRSYNQYAAEQSASGRPLPPSDAAFIEKASGVKSRYVIDPDGILDPQRMRPRISVRRQDEQSLQCEAAVAAAQGALTRAQCQPATIDAVIAACSNFQRPYPAIAIEVQAALGAQGFAFDMNVACSSATMALQVARDTIAAGHATRVLVVNPEFCSAHLNFRDRDSHFIFGDACTAFVVEKFSDQNTAPRTFEILSTRLLTRFSNNIRNDAGFLTPAEDRERDDPALLFQQQGPRVFREVAPLVVCHLREHLCSQNLPLERIRRLWLHQANAVMNQYIARKLLEREPEAAEAPSIIEEFANTSSAGSIIAFHRHHDDLEPGEVGILCSFGAGYSVGSAILKRCA